MSDNSLVVLNDASFTQLVLDNENPSEVSLILFGASWCAPYKQVKPNVEAVAAKHAATVKAYYYDVDAQNSVAFAYNIRGVPMILAFKNKRLFGTLQGFRTTAQLEALISSQPVRRRDA